MNKETKGVQLIMNPWQAERGVLVCAHMLSRERACMDLKAKHCNFSEQTSSHDITGGLLLCSE